jgi:hypothetical protein
MFTNAMNRSLHHLVGMNQLGGFLGLMVHLTTGAEKPNVIITLW